jgi:hypothetical protein
MWIAYGLRSSTAPPVFALATSDAGGLSVPRDRATSPDPVVNLFALELPEAPNAMAG